MITNRKMSRRLACMLAASLVAGSMLMEDAAAQSDWPTRTVRLVVPFAPGGASDAVARTIASKLAEKWGQAVVIDNKPGANTAIGAMDVVRAAPDGYTLFQAINSTLTVNPFTFSKLAYDPIEDFTPISTVATIPIVFVANESISAKSVPELVAQARVKPASLSIGHGTVGLRLAAERFGRDANMKLTYVPYKSGVDVTKGLLSGEINLAVDAVAANLPHIRNGKLRAIATNHSSRLSALPDVPTLAEVGYRNSEAGMWLAFMAPAGLPVPLRDRISGDIKQVLQLEDVQARFRDLGVEPGWQPGDEVTGRIRTESAAFGPLIKELGLTAN